MEVEAVNEGLCTVLGLLWQWEIAEKYGRCFAFCSVLIYFSIDSQLNIYSLPLGGWLRPALC